MNLIFLFRRLVFAQVILGIVGFCMAERNPGLLLLSGTLAALSWYVVEGPAGRPLPQWLILLGLMISVVWLVVDLARSEGEIIIAMGHFTMWLQVLLLYGRKSNREYGEILVLSLLQMIGASVLSVSVFYGLMLVGYCGLSLFTILLFQLKNTSDVVLEANQAAAPPGVQVSRPPVVVGRGHRGQFRVVSLVIGVACTAIASGVFLLVPRSTFMPFSPYLLNPLVEKQAGFNAMVRLDGSAPNDAGRAPVLHLKLSIDGREQHDEEAGWLLRGAALDRYDGLSHTWTRSPGSEVGDMETPLAPHGQTLAAMPEHAPIVEADIVLRNTSQACLFTLFPVSWIRSEDLSSVLFNTRDQQVAAPLAILFGTIHYQLRSPLLDGDGVPGPTPLADGTGYARGWSVDLPAIRRLAQQALRARGVERDPAVKEHPDDALAARVLTDFLRVNYRYSLSNAALPPAEEPISDFLFVSRQGHCELFAAGLAALARSVGMRARVVTGFRAGEFNHVGGYYTVRRSHAHAWTEVYCGPQGWRAFDATPDNAVAREHRAAHSWLTPLREAYDYLEFIWVNRVVAYDHGTRGAVVGGVSHSLEDAARAQWAAASRAAEKVRQFFGRWQLDQISLTLTCVSGFFIIVGIASFIRLIVVRHRRLVALQLTALPRSQRRSLVKQLRFYLVMLDMLERYGFVRPAWQSPFSFAQQLATAQPRRFDAVVTLTEHFYEIRFGYRHLDRDRRKIIDTNLARLSQALIRKSSGKAGDK